jgi:hypothetical protein
MSSWSLLTALSGFHFNGPRGILSFIPRHTPDNHKSLFTAPEAWGSVKQTRSEKLQRAEIAVVEGTLRVKELRHRLSIPERGPEESRGSDVGIKVTIGDRVVAHSDRISQDKDSVVTFQNEVVIRAGETMVTTLTSARPGAKKA